MGNVRSVPLATDLFPADLLQLAVPNALPWPPRSKAEADSSGRFWQMALQSTLNAGCWSGLYGLGRFSDSDAASDRSCCNRDS